MATEVWRLSLYVCWCLSELFLFCRAVIPSAKGFTCEHWQRVPEFQHPDPGQGIPVNIESSPMSGPGHKLFWLYHVSAYVNSFLARLKLINYAFFTD